MSCCIDRQDIEMLSSMSLPYAKLENKCILITGANGLIGSAMVDTLMNCKKFEELNVSVVALSRNLSKAENRFADYMDSNRFTLLIQDVCDAMSLRKKVDYIIHAASPSHPIAYAEYPVDVIKANILGVLNTLDFARENQARIMYISSGEVYGERSTDNEGMDEDYLGLLNFLDTRACYPEAKRASENLCVSYKAQFGVDVVIARPSHIYGAGVTSDNSRADAQFLRKVINHEDIVLKSTGTQKRSYCYISDCVSALLNILLLGLSGEAYNIANKNSVVTIKEYAQTLADLGHVTVVYDIPTTTEAQGYSKNPNAILKASKLEELGWVAQFDIRQGLLKTYNSTLVRQNS